MKKIVSSLLVICMILSAFTIVGAAANWSKASDWAVNDLNEAYDMGLFPECLKNKDLTFKITRAEQAALSVKIYEVATGIEAVAAQNPFSDTTDEEVLKALSLGVTSGTSATTFEPDASLTREQAATMLSRIYKKINIDGWALDKDSEFKFEFDMPDSFKDHSKISSWAEQSVYFMASKQWILGNESKEFMPLDSCSREQALIIAKRMATFFKENQKEKFKVVCVGGTFTSNGSRWIKALQEYLQQKMPDKQVTVLNAGIAHTSSNYGAMHFQRNVISQEPDIVLIDYTASDMPDYENQAPYVESMLRQCINAKKVPGVAFIHSPYPVAETDAEFKGWKSNYQNKENLAAHYGAESINIYEYTKKLYAESGSEEPYIDWVELYFNRLNSSYLPLKPKPRFYGMVGEAIIKAFDEKGIDSFTKPIENKPVYLTEQPIATATYNVIPVTDERLDYQIGWELMSINNRYGGWVEYSIPTYCFAYPYYPEGLIFSRVGASSTGFKSTANAVYVSYLSLINYSVAAKILVDGKQVGSMSTHDSDLKDKNCVTTRYPVSDTGEEKLVEIATQSGGGFRMCAIIEEFID